MPLPAASFALLIAWGVHTLPLGDSLQSYAIFGCTELKSWALDRGTSNFTPGEREGYGGPCDVTSLSLSKKTPEY